MNGAPLEDRDVGADRREAGDTYTNIAEGKSHVDAQIGVVHGDVSFYKISGAETPEEKFRIGCNYLAGNMPRQAEELIRGAFMAGFRSNRVSYYWSLAVLSNRSFDHLGEDEFDQLRQAFAEIDRHTSDQWLVALDVVAQLVQDLTIQEEHPDLNPPEFDITISHFEGLAVERRDELRRHLEMILTGRIQDRLEAKDAAEVAAKRMDEDRLGRAWTFFEPKPEPPRIIPVPKVESRGRDIAAVASGVCLLVLVLFPGGYQLLGENPPLLVVSVLLYIGGAYAVVRYGLQRWALLAQEWWAEGRYREPPPWAMMARKSWAEVQYRTTQPGRRGVENQPGKSKSDVPTFAAQIEERLNRRFASRPRPGADRRLVSSWMHDSWRIRATIAREIVRQYESKDSLPTVGAVDWLIRWHAVAMFAKWEKGNLRGDKQQAVSQLERVCCVVGPSMLCLSLSTTAVNATIYHGGSGLLAAAGWVVGNAAIWVGAAALHRKSSLAAWLAIEAQQRKLRENKAYADWHKKLENRPTDAQIASWLDSDKAHLKATAMKHFGLANRDLIAHVVLTGPAAATYAARVLYGPLRYSDYTVHVFLLTERGVREMSVDLHLTSGVISDEKRRNFRYDAVSSAQVSEMGIRIDGLNSDPAEKELVGRDKAKWDAAPEKLVFSQEFELTLNNMQAVRLIIGNFDEGLIDRVREDARHLFELARDTSGVTPALRILEAIAAEGSDWVAQERLRRRHRIIDYRRKMGELIALGDGGHADGAEVPVPRIGKGQARYQLTQGDPS